MAPGREHQESLPNPTQRAAGVYRDLLDPSSPWWLDHEFPGRKMVCMGQFQQALGTSRVQGRVISSRVLVLSPARMTARETQERHRWLVLLAHARSVRPGCSPGYCSIAQTAGSNDRQGTIP